MERICKTCRYNLGFDFPPTPGGPQDGVRCGNMEALREILDDPEINEPTEIWRVEVVTPGEECEFWDKKREV